MTPAAVRRRAILQLLLANLLWGLSFPLIKALVLVQERLLPGAGGAYPALLTVAPRFVLAVLVLLAWRPGEAWRATAREWRQGLLLGLFAAGGMLWQNDGLRFTSASTSAFLTQLYAVLIPVWVGLHARRNPGPAVWLAVLLVLAGTAVLGGFNPFGGDGLRFGRGEIETLLGSLFFMGQILVLGRPEFAGNRAAKITFTMFATEAVLFSGLAVATAPDATALVVPWTSSAWVGIVVLLCGFCTLGAFSLMNLAQPKISATEAGLIYCFEPPFAAALAWFLPGWISPWAGVDYPNESLTWTLLVGGLLITAANVVVQWRPPGRDAASATGREAA